MSESSGPKRGDPHYEIYCPNCDRHGVMAGWRHVLTGEFVKPENLTCPECGGKIEVKRRVDQ